MQRRDLNAPDTPPPIAAYTNAIEVSGTTRTLYISGQVGQRMDGTNPDDIEHSRLAWQNLEAQARSQDSAHSTGTWTLDRKSQGNVCYLREADLRHGTENFRLGSLRPFDCGPRTPPQGRFRAPRENIDICLTNRLASYTVFQKLTASSARRFFEVGTTLAIHAK
jgi:hypothetical protein